MKIPQSDYNPYRPFAKRQHVDKAIQTLIGLLLGVTIDDELNPDEIAGILNWCNEYNELISRAPFDELIPKLNAILEDGIVAPEEQDELLWLCRNLSPENEFYSNITHDIQRLHGILHGILANENVSTIEAKQLQTWVDDHSHLKGNYPYDELDSLLTSILSDSVVDEEEQKLLQAFFENFIEYSFSKKLSKESKKVKEGISRKFTLPGVCAKSPEISFKGRNFTFTGPPSRGERSELINTIVELGGEFSPNISNETEFLVIGSAGNPCWAFSCYGQKVEKALEYRKGGHPIVIVHESDFWDAVESHN